VATVAAEQRTRQIVKPPDSFAAKLGRAATHAPVHIVLAFVGVLWLVPTIGLFLTSLMKPEVIGTTGWWHVLSQPHLFAWTNYSNLFHNTGIPATLRITAEIAIGGTILPILVAASAAYAFAWMEFPGRDWLFVLVIALLVVPLQMALIPVFHLYNVGHLYDTIAGLVLFHTAFGLPFAIFLLRNFFVGLPRDIMESARIDGASEIRIFVKLILPLGLPAIASLGIFQFLWVWNDMLIALIYADTESAPLTVALQSQSRAFGANIDVLAPGAFLSLIVPVIVFFSFQRYFVQGVMAGAVK
jgi:alpha-glucoside transport system permease protein